ncbi:hypothetical protein JQ543_21640 [Bradyrhizobium diazoefficiens]|nr:hypothetical protein [Bradyrhizobium diazoefficiens]MBR0773985.1 hypothetical protein [Bradyrhizobium diazoefficiens]MBR0850360.1 hypothetical protein [Bradyrhizobium diazoefficiens]
MSITEIRILPPFAIARLGASETPLENYDLVLDDNDALGFRKITGAETFRVDRATGEIKGTYTPDRVKFRDGGAIRPVAPFLEVFARTGDDALEPLTLALLDKHKLKPASLAWKVEVGNHKIFRRTGIAADRIEAKAEFNDHAAHALEGHCVNFFHGKVLPLGSVQYIKPTRAFPEIRLRFTPAGGWVYGSSDKRKTVNAFNKVVETRDDIISPERIIYDPKKGTWRGFDDGKTPAPERTVPGAIYAGYSDPKSGDQISWGYLDDECDGIVTATLVIGGKTLSAFARIAAGPPTFAPDSVPIRTAADELDQVLLGPEADASVTLEDAEEIVRRAIESVRLMNTAAMNGNTIEGRINVASTMVRQDTNDFSRYYQPIMTPTSVDNHALMALHQNILAALRSGTGAWFAQALRQPDEIGDLSDAGRRKMPAMMRGADGRMLALSRRQIDTIVKNAVGDLFSASKRGAKS